MIFLFVVFQLLMNLLYNFLHQKLPDVKLINNIDDVPEVQEFDDKFKNQSKLIVLMISLIYLKKR
jgi:hypothetical protein